MKATNALKGRLSKHLRLFEVNEAQFAMLQLLYRNGAMLQKDLAARRRRHKDRREVSVSISSYGKFIMDFVEPGAVWTMKEVVKELTPGELEELTQLCERLIEGAVQVGEYGENEHHERHFKPKTKAGPGRKVEGRG